MNYLKGVRQELKKVSWPSFSEVNHFTWISIMFIIVFALYFALTDSLFTRLMDWLLSL